MKSANCISATGRIPLTAIPMAMPTMAVSARGVSMIWRSPKRARNPSVARKAPPMLPTSSPMMTTLSSRSSSSAKASLIASRTVFSATLSPVRGVDLSVRALGDGVRA